LSAALEASGRRWIVPHERKCRIRLGADEAHGCPQAVFFGYTFGSFNDEVVNIRERLRQTRRRCERASLL
jgi:hypothetical protein